MRYDVSDRVRRSIEVKNLILQDKKIAENIEDIVDVIVKAFQNGNKVLFCGNGGSAADAQHLAAEFSGKFYLDRTPLFSEALHCNTSYITAVANDYSFDEIYSRLIQGKCNAGDVLVGLSTSGNSKNIVRAFETARNIGVITVGFTGMSGGEMKKCSDYLINVPSSDTPRVQESQMMIGHIICEFVEQLIFSQSSQ